MSIPGRGRYVRNNYLSPAPYEPWKNVFNWTMTYRTDSDIFSPSSRLVLRNRGPLSDEMYCKFSRFIFVDATEQYNDFDFVHDREDYVNLSLFITTKQDYQLLQKH